MDLSGLIFVALAVAWAAYLIPMALKRTDDLATTRAVEDFSSRLRVFGGRRTAEETAAPAESVAAPAPAPATRVIASMSPANRAAARRAAARRRRVLYVLTASMVATAVAAALHYIPLWSIGAPAGLIVVFLFIARITVKRERARRRIEIVVPVDAAEPAPVAAPTSVEAEDVEETVGLTAQALAEVKADEPVADEGSLWDPVPVTLPTYVTKPRARRTVRTIELTQSSGHDAADSKLARDADAARAAKTESEKKADTDAPRKAAGA